MMCLKYISVDVAYCYDCDALAVVQYDGDAAMLMELVYIQVGDNNVSLLYLYYTGYSKNHMLCKRNNI